MWQPFIFLNVDDKWTNIFHICRWNTFDVSIDFLWKIGNNLEEMQWMCREFWPKNTIYTHSISMCNKRNIHSTKPNTNWNRTWCHCIQIIHESLSFDREFKYKDNTQQERFSEEKVPSSLYPEKMKTERIACWVCVCVCVCGVACVCMHVYACMFVF